MGNFSPQKIYDLFVVGYLSPRKYMTCLMNWVPMARNGLICWENEATGSRKVSKYLLGLRDAIVGQKRTQYGNTKKLFWPNPQIGLLDRFEIQRVPQLINP